MSIAVRLTVLTGPHRNHRFCFCGRNRCPMGRAADCFVQFSGTERDQLISRHHCRLDIDPPTIRVEDLGSANGTYLNGRHVAPHQEAAALADAVSAGLPVQHGDLLTMGGTTIRVELVDCPRTTGEPDGPCAWPAAETAIRDCPLQC